MRPIIQTDDFAIEQDKTSPHLHAITFPSYATNSHILIDSLVKTQILLGTTTTINKKNGETKLFFNATSVTQLKKKHSYAQNIKFIYDLTKQLNYLIQKTEHCFLGYSPTHTIVIDENKCIYLSTEHLQPINQSNCLPITYPYSKYDFFLSPELKKIKEIPSQVHFKTSYYSLACLAIHSFFLEQEQKQEEEQEQKQEQKQEEEAIENNPIKGTKMYWFLKRALSQEPESRSLIYF